MLFETKRYNHGKQKEQPAIWGPKDLPLPPPNPSNLIRGLGNLETSACSQCLSTLLPSNKHKHQPFALLDPSSTDQEVLLPTDSRLHRGKPPSPCIAPPLAKDLEPQPLLSTGHYHKARTRSRSKADQHADGPSRPPRNPPEPSYFRRPSRGKSRCPVESSVDLLIIETPSSPVFLPFVCFVAGRITKHSAVFISVVVRDSLDEQVTALSNSPSFSPFLPTCVVLKVPRPSCILSRLELVRRPTRHTVSSFPRLATLLHHARATSRSQKASADTSSSHSRSLRPGAVSDLVSCCGGASRVTLLQREPLVPRLLDSAAGCISPSPFALAVSGDWDTRRRAF